MPRIIETKRITWMTMPVEQREFFRCFFNGCSLEAINMTIIRDDRAILKLCLCEDHSKLSAEKIVSDIGRHRLCRGR